MKNKILYTDVTKAVEDLALALRKFSGGSMFASIELLTRDEDQDDDAPDLYTFRIHEPEVDTPTLAEGGWIYRDGDDKIVSIKRIGGEK